VQESVVDYRLRRAIVQERIVGSRERRAAVQRSVVTVKNGGQCYKRLLSIREGRAVLQESVVDSSKSLRDRFAITPLSFHSRFVVAS
jgi:hypothetical protein